MDDGYSGVTFDRSAYLEMMAEVEAGRVSTIIVKDHSRLGRNRLVVGILLEETFAQYHVRYIAVNDGVDTINGIDDSIAVRDSFKNISHSGKVSNDFSLFRRFCCINRCFRCSCGKFSIVHGVQAAIGF